jgi:hypothetical protein
VLNSDFSIFTSICLYELPGNFSNTYQLGKFKHCYHASSSI